MMLLYSGHPHSMLQTAVQFRTNSLSLTPSTYYLHNMHLRQMVHRNRRPSVRQLCLLSHRHWERLTLSFSQLYAGTFNRNSSIRPPTIIETVPPDTAFHLRYFSSKNLRFCLYCSAITVISI